MISSGSVNMSKIGRVVVIGAGTAGICAAKTAREHGLDVAVYEQSDRIGKQLGNSEIYRK